MNKKRDWTPITDKEAVRLLAIPGEFPDVFFTMPEGVRQGFALRLGNDRTLPDEVRRKARMLDPFTAFVPERAEDTRKSSRITSTVNNRFYIIPNAQVFEISHSSFPSGRLRMHAQSKEKLAADPSCARLQQEIVTTTYRFGRAIGTASEWCDVPFYFDDDSELDGSDVHP